MIHVLKKQGYSIRAIAKIVGLDRKTVTKRLKEDQLKPIARKNNKRLKLESYKDYIINRISKSVAKIPSVVILHEIQKYGYKGGLRTLQNFLSLEYAKRIKPDPVVRFETAPGYQAQVDWTTIKSGKHPIYAFVMTLGYSRNSFVWFTNSMNSEVLIDCHHRAFAYFGGVTKTILYDNMKTAVEIRNAYGTGKHKFSSSLLDLSKTYGFSIKLCQPYRAKTKGKVERFNHYLKGNFYNPLVARLADTTTKISVELLNNHIFDWLNLANDRIHGTTGKKPSNSLKEEIPYLLEYLKPVPVAIINQNNLANQLIDVPLVPIEQPLLQNYDRLVV